ncbi:MAG: hypothetical protein ACTHMI_20380 [Mucilaginibacter sp.]
MVRRKTLRLTCYKTLREPRGILDEMGIGIYHGRRRAMTFADMFIPYRESK